MPLWKQAMFRRLHAPADGEGSDLGASAATNALENLGLVEEEDPAPPADGEQQSEQAAAPAEHQPEKPQPSELEALLDGMTDDPNAPKKEAVGADEASSSAGNDGAPSGEQKPVAPKTPEQEDAELLEGVKSERGRERIQKMIAERKQAQADVDEFRQMVQSTGMTQQDFAQSLEFGRLVSSNDPANLAVALEMVEQQRLQLYQRLGKEAPGVDLLQGHDDLRQQVENMELPRAQAVELANHRRAQAAQAQNQQAQRAQQQDQQQFQQTVAAAAQGMEAYLATRAKEIDHPARMKVLQEHFRDPAKMQEFVGTFLPHQWAKAMQMMYDGIRVQPAPQQQVQRPIRSRPASLGAPAASGSTPEERLLAGLDSLGL